MKIALHFSLVEGQSNRSYFFFFFGIYRLLANNSSCLWFTTFYFFFSVYFSHVRLGQHPQPLTALSFVYRSNQLMETHLFTFSFEMFPKFASVLLDKHFVDVCVSVSVCDWYEKWSVQDIYLPISTMGMCVSVFLCVCVKIQSLRLSVSVCPASVFFLHLLSSFDNKPVEDILL